MKVVILLVFAFIAIVSSVPLGPDEIHPNGQEDAPHDELAPLNRIRSPEEDPKQDQNVESWKQQGDYIKAGAVHSSKYGGGGEIVANKNLASSKHHSVDAQTKYRQYGNHREGWAGINYSVRW